MYQTFRFLIILILLQQATVHALSESIHPAVIEQGVVKGATHYHLIAGGKTLVWGRTEKPVEVVHSPCAFFYKYRPEGNEFLGAVEVSAFDKQRIDFLSSLIDPQSKPPIIKRAAISHCIKRGRYVVFYDENGNEVDRSYRYNGSIDIKSEKDNIKLIYPHSLLEELEEVKEIKPRSWLLELLGVSRKEESIQYKQ